MSRAHIKHARTWPDFADTVPVVHETQHVQNVVLENQQFEQPRDRTGSFVDMVIYMVVAPVAVLVVVLAIWPK